jgi:hypothetical protein
MKSITAAGACIVAAALAVGCDRGRSENDELNADRERTGTAVRDEEPISVTGCVTARGDQFVLTRLDEDATPIAATEVYQLRDVDDDEDLTQHVGRVVQVFGEAPPAAVAQVEQTTPGASGTSGNDGNADVTVRQTTRFEARPLEVASVVATGRPCPAAQSDSPTTAQ